MVGKPHLLIVEARFYADIADALVEGAVEAIEAVGGTYDRIEVPGAFEIPAAIRFAADGAASGGIKYDGYVGLGCVIRGETSHYDYVCEESARGLQQLAIVDRLAIGYGVLTVENAQHAWARADKAQKNKGGDVANAALRMIESKKKFGGVG